MGTFLFITSQYEHVTEIESYIRTVKERVGSTVNTLPYPSRMKVETVYDAVFWLSLFYA
jgi:hypothetical protein